jgi:hypothetical protein
MHLLIDQHFLTSLFSEISTWSFKQSLHPARINLWSSTRDYIYYGLIPFSTLLLCRHTIKGEIGLYHSMHTHSERSSSINEHEAANKECKTRSSNRPQRLATAGSRSNTCKGTQSSETNERPKSSKKAKEATIMLTQPARSVGIRKRYGVVPSPPAVRWWGLRRG